MQLYSGEDYYTNDQIDKIIKDTKDKLEYEIDHLVQETTYGTVPTSLSKDGLLLNIVDRSVR